MTHGSEIVRREPLETGLSATDRDRVRRALAAAGSALPELMQAGRWSTSAMPALYVRAQSAGHGAVAKYYADSTNDSAETREAAS